MARKKKPETSKLVAIPLKYITEIRGAITLGRITAYSNANDPYKPDNDPSRVAWGELVKAYDQVLEQLKG